MSLKLILTIFFITVFIYSLIRPFTSNYAKISILIGSFLGALFSNNTKLLALISDYVGLEKTLDLVLYIFIVFAFLFCIYIINRFKEIDNKMSEIAKKLALKNSRDS